VGAERENTRFAVIDERRRSRRAPAHALEMIERIVHEAECPVIAVLEGDDSAFVDEAAKRGVFAYIVRHSRQTLVHAAQAVLDGHLLLPPTAPA
jgi:DNA-binding NarL/FixJ family response regulator